MAVFRDRQDAGRRLVTVFANERTEDSVVVSLPRGGTVVGSVVAKDLKLPHYILIVKKIGAPDNPELALGAMGSSLVYWDDHLLRSLRITDKVKESLVASTKEEIVSREKRFGVGPLPVRGKKTIVVDDGVATGATAIAASHILKKLGSRSNILATPVISSRTREELMRHFDKIITVKLPQDFRAIGEFYDRFTQVTDEEIAKIMGK